MAEPASGHPALLETLRSEIRASGPLTFERFMEVALYDPEAGYYARGPAPLGRRGDFITASDVGTVFGEIVARQIAELDAFLGKPAPFRYVEAGAGRGLLARDVLDALAGADPSLRHRCEATLVDASPGMREAAASVVPEARVVPPGSGLRGGVGCVVAVELFDALPVRRVRRRPEGLVEVRVGIAGEGLAEIETSADPEVVAWAQAYGAAPLLWDEAEVSLRLGPTVRSLADTIERGYLLVFDYGATGAALYGPRHRRGTLLAYHRHAVSEDTLARVGEQDLTSHVNFSALAAEAAPAGLTLLGTTTQDRFLIANGILELVRSSEADTSPAAVKRRLQVKELIHPDGFGRAFQVAILAKGLAGAPVPRGLRDPFHGGR